MGSHPHHANKKADNKSHLLFYGASNGRELEDNCVFVAHQTLHETELMMNIKKWIRA